MENMYIYIYIYIIIIISRAFYGRRAFRLRLTEHNLLSNINLGLVGLLIEKQALWLAWP